MTRADRIAFVAGFVLMLGTFLMGYVAAFAFVAHHQYVDALGLGVASTGALWIYSHVASEVLP